MKGRTLQIVGIICLILIAVNAVFVVNMYYGKEIMSEKSSDNKYELIISHTNEPGAPADTEVCALRLKKGLKEISNTSVYLVTGGEAPDSSCFKTEWHADRVNVTVTSPGGESSEYKLFFSGDVERPSEEDGES